MIHNLGTIGAVLAGLATWTTVCLGQTATLPAGHSRPPLPPPARDLLLDLPVEQPIYVGPPVQPASPLSPPLKPPLQPPPPPPSPPASPPQSPPIPEPGQPTDSPPEEPQEPTDEPPPTFYGEEIESENDTIFYVLDVSCSMSWGSSAYVGLDGQRRSGNRLQRAKVELGRSILGLSQNFRFNILAYDCSNQQWRGSMQEANDGNKQAAMAWVQGRNPDGATGTGPAVVLALSDRQNMSVVLLTDGEPNCGVPVADSGGWWEDDTDPSEDHRRVIRQGNTQGAVINVFGIAATGAQRRFCQAVASDSGGSYFDVP